MNQNPFYFGGAVPPNKFVARKSDINTAFDVIQQRGCLAIQGSNGMGKSSLLQYVAEPSNWVARNLDPSQALVIFLNCGEIEPRFTKIAFWQQVMIALQKKAVADSEIQLVIEQILQQNTYTVNELRQLLWEIGKVNKFLLLLLDDFDTTLHENHLYNEDEMRSFLSNFRNLATNNQEKDYLSVIVTCHKRLSDMGPEIRPGTSPWNNHYTQRSLRLLQPRELNQWLENLCQRYSLPWLKYFEAGIQEISGGHPALVQSAGFILYRAWQDRDIQSVKDLAREFENQNRLHFKGAWELSTDDEKSLLKFIALSRLEGRLNHKRQYTLDGVDIILSQKDRELRDLEYRGILRRLDDGERENYVFASSIMEWWVIKELENSQQEPQLSERELVFLNLSSKQVTQTRNILQQLWQHKDTIQDVAGWMGKLGGNFVQGLIKPSGL